MLDDELSVAHSVPSVRAGDAYGLGVASLDVALCSDWKGWTWPDMELGRERCQAVDLKDGARGDRTSHWLRV